MSDLFGNPKDRFSRVRSQITARTPETPLYFGLSHINRLVRVFAIFDLFEMMLYVPVNSNGHVGTLPPLYGTLGCHDIQIVLHRYNTQAKPIQFICMDGLTEPLFLVRLRLERRFTNNQIIGSVGILEALPGGTISLSIPHGPQWAGPIFPLDHPLKPCCFRAEMKVNNIIVSEDPIS